MPFSARSARCDGPEVGQLSILALDHVQLAMPEAGEHDARRFYGHLLGLREVAKPANLALRGGVWFEHGNVRVHLGVEKDFAPARKAHPAFLVDDLEALVGHLAANGVAAREDEPLEGYARVYVSDPFG